jgi:YgiT-type zinc finger domain-containing protein
MCKTGQTKPGHTTVTLQEGDTVVVVKKVPGDICSQCGEYYLEDSVVARLEEILDSAASRGAEVEIVKYAA